MAATVTCPSCQRSAPSGVGRCDCGTLLRCPKCGWHEAEAAPVARGCFGEYLVRKGLIGDDQLVAALDEQASQQEHFGHIAVRHGMLTANQLLAVLNAQVAGRGRFGEVAVALGFMSEDQVNEVLDMQRKGRPPIGEVLVTMGVITQPEVERMLVVFQGERSAAAARTGEADA